LQSPKRGRRDSHDGDHGMPGVDLIFGNRKLAGALTGDLATGDATLRFSALSGVSAIIETVPLENALSVSIVSRRN
jgi:D-arabinose 1-dehydrogenase-like Zn-dependent alcohol dehydrogenase